MLDVSRFVFLVVFFFCLTCCKEEKGHYDFELESSPPEFKTSDLIWENTALGASLYVKNENPNERGNRSWFELQVKKRDGQLSTYLYYYVNMQFGGIRNDTLLLADLKKETNEHIPNGWYLIDSAKNLFAPIDLEMQEFEFDSITKTEIVNRILKFDEKNRGIFKITKSGAVQKTTITYEEFNPSLIDVNKCNNCLYYFNISRRINKFYNLKDLVNQAKTNNVKIIKPTYTQEGGYQSLED